MADLDLVVRARRVVTPAGTTAAAVLVRDGRIVAVDHLEAVVDAATDVRLPDDEVLLPGLVDTHVHVNEPGRTEWEGFASATRAAAAGGVTTIVDMPLNSIPATVDAEALALKHSAALGRCTVDVGFWGGAVPGNLDALAELHELGVLGFKCFLLDSGVPEFPPLDEAGLHAALTELGGLGALLIVHAEDAEAIAAAPPPDGADYAAFLASRPPEAETRAIDRVIAAARATGARAHIVHLAAADALPALAAARADGVRITVETCPHYLTLDAESVPAGATPFKCCPPIRSAANADLLWAGLRAGTIDAIVTDHSPSTADLKCLDTGDFGAAWGGIASLQLGLRAVWTAARERGVTLDELVDWMSAGPARLVGLTSKGAIAPGRDADLVAFAPDATGVVDAAALEHRNPVTPYAGRALAGAVRTTWLRGVPVVLDGALVGGTPVGRLLSRGDQPGEHRSIPEESF